MRLSGLNALVKIMLMAPGTPSMFRQMAMIAKTIHAMAMAGTILAENLAMALSPLKMISAAMIAMTAAKK